MRPSKTIVLYISVFLACILTCINISFSEPSDGEDIVDFDKMYGQFKKEIVGKSVFPQNNIWNTPVDKLPAHPKSDLFVRAIGERASLKPNFGEDWETGAVAGIPYMVVSSSQLKAHVTFANDFESDPGPYPVPNDFPVEGGPDAHGKRRVIVVDKDSWTLYEMSNAWHQGANNWYAETGAVFDLNTNTLRPFGWASADSAGLPVFPGLVRYEEVEAGEIKHALRFAARSISSHSIWPARHFNAGEKDDNLPSMGQYFRLKANLSIARFSPKARVILTALKKYGMILSDNGDNWLLSGTHDERWDENLIRELQQLKGYNFEAVDISSLMVNRDSGAVKGESASGIPAPQDLAARAVSPTKIMLRWSIPRDITGIVKFNIYRDGEYADTTIDRKYSDTAVKESTEYIYSVTACDAENNESASSEIISVETPEPPDTTPPAHPKKLTAEVISHSRINLIWMASNDNKGTTGYTIRRNGSVIDSTEKTHYADTGLEGSTEYTYTVIAYDAAGNESKQSNSIVKTTLAPPDVEPPGIPANVKAEALAHNTIRLNWDHSADNKKLAGYRIYRNGTALATAEENNYVDSAAAESTEYTYVITSVDAAGNESGRSELIIITTPEPPDTKAPSTPERASGTPVSPTQIRLSWAPSTDNVEVTGYRIYRNGALAGSSETAVFSDSGLKPSSSYTYTISACDAAGNESTQSAPIGLETPHPPDTQAPSIPENFDAAALSPTQIDLTWTPSGDNTEVAGYKLLRNGKEITRTRSTSYSDIHLTPSTMYSYTVISFDTAGNESSKSVQISIETLKPPDTAAPTVPVSLNARAVSHNRITLSWEQSTDNERVKGYRIFRNGTVLAETEKTVYTDEKLTPQTAYRYTVSAFDEAGNESTPSAPGKAVTPEMPDTAAPSVPESFNATAVSPVQVDLNWRPAADNKAVTGYTVYRNGIRVSTTASNRFSDKKLKPETAYSYAVSAFDAAGNESGRSGRITVKTLKPPDTAAPTVPVSLNARAVSHNRITLSWEQSTDNETVKGYRIFRNGTVLAETEKTVYTDEKLTPQTAYRYTVSAFDEAGNESTPSAPGKAVTPEMPDTAAPSVPESFNATAVSPVQVDLNWRPAADNKAVTGYTVYRNGTRVSTTASNRFSDKKLKPETAYSYAVSAFDAAGNESGRSGRITVKTLKPPDTAAPTVPVSLNARAVSHNRITLSWEQSTDNERVKGYRIFRNGTVLAETEKTVYTDEKLTPQTAYRYTVSAFDEAGNESTPSAPGKAVTPEMPDTAAPSVPESFNATAVSPVQVDLNWRPAADNKAVTGYTVYRNGIRISTTASNRFSDKKLKPETAYSYAVSAFDAAGNESGRSGRITVKTLKPPDTAAPTVPAGIKTDAVLYNRVIIQWTASTDNRAVTGYRIYRNGKQLGTSPKNRYTDRNVNAVTQYTYSVTAFDEKGNESKPSAIYKLTTPAPPDKTAPEIPGNITVKSVSPTRIVIQWAQSRDNVKTAGYTVYRNGKKIGVSEHTRYSDDFLAPSTAYTYSVSSYDESGNSSIPSAPIKAATQKPVDVSPPSVPKKLIGKPVSHRRIDLNWEKSSDNTGIAGYKLYRNNRFIQAVETSFYSDTSVAPSTSYKYGISAFDEAGNESKTSTGVTVKTPRPPDTKGPTAPSGLKPDAVSHTAIELVWKPSRDDTGIKEYIVYRNGTPLKPVARPSFSDKKLKPASQYNYHIVAMDFAGNASEPSPTLSITTKKPPDTTPPTIPETIDTRIISHREITLQWTPSTDNEAVHLYNLYRNGTLIATTVEPEFSDTDLKALTEYVYSVSAIDTAGNESAKSKLKKIKTTEPPDIQAPSVTGNIKVRAASPTHINISWDQSVDNKKVAGYLLYRNNTRIASTDKLYYSDEELKPLTTYSYSIISYDEAGNKSKPSTVVSIKTPEPPDTKAPGKPGEPEHVTITPEAVELRWDAATDNTGVTGYNIYRNSVLVQTVSKTHCSDTGLIPSSPYSYFITAFDKAGNESRPSATIRITTPEPPDTEAPSSPGKLKAEALSPVQINLEWDKSRDNKKVITYRVFRNGTAAATVTENTYTDKRLKPATQYEYRVTALDEAGNESRPSATITISTPEPPDTEAPSIPGNLSATIAGPARATLSWDRSSDKAGVTGYILSRNGKEIAMTQAETYSDSTLKPSAQYTYAVAAFDKAGNRSDFSKPVHISTPEPPDTEAPTAPGRITAKSVSHERIELVWKPSKDNIEVTGYIVYRNGKQIGKSKTPDYSDALLKPLSEYVYSVGSFDNAGNMSKRSREIRVSTPDAPDTVPPAVPGRLTAAAISHNRIELSWKPSRDNRRTVSYSIYRNGQLVDTTEKLIYTDDGLEPLTQYAYTVSAYDAAGNESKHSKTVALATPEAPDTTPPSVPASLQVKIISPTQIRLEWRESSDAKGIAGYRVYRNSAPVSTTKNQFYSDTGLKAAQKYKYSITAFDAAGNESKHTKPIRVSTPSIPKIKIPSTPEKVTASPISPSRVNLEWAPIQNNVLLAGYKVYRNGTLIHTTMQTSYSDTGLNASTKYRYTVTAYGKSGKESKESGAAVVQTPSIIAFTPVKKNAYAVGKTACIKTRILARVQYFYRYPSPAIVHVPETDGKRRFFDTSPLEYIAFSPVTVEIRLFF